MRINQVKGVGRGIAVVALACLMTACGGAVKVYKVSDGKAKEVGVPFYMPRPFVAVAKPFPIGGDSYFVTGTVSEDGNLINLDPPALASLPSDLKKRLSGGVPVASAVKLVAQSGGDKEGESEAKDSKDKTEGKDDKNDKNETEGKDDKDKDDGEKEKKVEASVVASGNPASNPVQQVNELFSIVYLPDFSERYEIRASGDSVKAAIALENGWMLENLSIETHSPLSDFVYKTLDRVVGVAADYFNGKFIAPLTEKEQEEIEEQAGKKVTIVMRVHYLADALPGVYPLLKPTELAKDPCADPKSRRDACDHLLVPISPYAMIPFNIRRDVVIEAVTPTGEQVPAVPRRVPRGTKQDLLKVMNDSVKGVSPALPANPITDVKRTPDKDNEDYTEIELTLTTEAKDRKKDIVKLLHEIFPGTTFK